jgi:hypothetical protein
MALDAFISRIKWNNVQRQNKYRITIIGPNGPMAENMRLFAETVEIPGQTIISAPDELRYGPTREMATAVSYGPTNITFICTPGMPERKFFTAWQNKVVNKDSWEAYYYKDYAYPYQISIFALDSEEKDKYGVTLFEVFPKTVSGQAFGAASNDAYQTIDVEFSFRYWREIPTPTTPAPRRARQPLPSLSESNDVISEDIWVDADPETRESTDPWTISQQRKQGFN